MATIEPPEYVLIGGVKPRIWYKGLVCENNESNCDEDRKKYAKFLGIRYAKPPIQEKRFEVFWIAY